MAQSLQDKPWALYFSPKSIAPACNLIQETDYQIEKLYILWKGNVLPWPHLTAQKFALDAASAPQFEKNILINNYEVGRKSYVMFLLNNDGFLVLPSAFVESNFSLLTELWLGIWDIKKFKVGFFFHVNIAFSVETDLIF